jgi:hypothetical protein
MAQGVAEAPEFLDDVGHGELKMSKCRISFLALYLAR